MGPMAQIRKDIAAFMARFYQVVNQVNELERQPYDFGVGELLYPSEIHTIQAIGNDSGINVTALADKMGITKAGVSKKINKLDKRGFVSKVRGMNNNKEVLLILTEKGQRAYDGHELFHAEMYDDFNTFIHDLSQEQIDVLEEVLDKVEQYAAGYRK